MLRGPGPNLDEDSFRGILPDGGLGGEIKNPGKYVDALVDLLEDAGSIPAASKILPNHFRCHHLEQETALFPETLRACEADRSVRFRRRCQPF